MAGTAGVAEAQTTRRGMWKSSAESRPSTGYFCQVAVQAARPLGEWSRAGRAAAFDGHKNLVSRLPSLSPSLPPSLSLCQPAFPSLTFVRPDALCRASLFRPSAGPRKRVVIWRKGTRRHVANGLSTAVSSFGAEWSTALPQEGPANGTVKETRWPPGGAEEGGDQAADDEETTLLASRPHLSM